MVDYNLVIFREYDKIKEQIEEYVSENDSLKLYEISLSFIQFLSKTRPEYTEKELKNISEFMLTIPLDIMYFSYVTYGDRMTRSSDEFRYLAKLHNSLLQFSNKFKNDFYYKMLDIGKEQQKLNSGG